MRSSLRCPYGAPQIASASADISASANVFTIACNRSGDAASNCSRRKPAGSTLLGAVIALVSFDHDLAVSKDLAMTVLYFTTRRLPGLSYTTSVDAADAGDRVLATVLPGALSHRPSGHPLPSRPAPS